MEIITAGDGTAHVSSADDGTIYAGIAGNECYVTGVGDRLSCTMQGANTALVGTGVGIMYGRAFRVAMPEEVTIQSGTQSRRRNDIICVHFTTSSEGHESGELVVLKGTPTSGQEAEDPDIPSGDILEGATEAYMPLWRIPLDGINVGEPEAMFESIPSLSSLRDSACRAGTLLLGGGWKAADDTVPQWRMLGDVVIVTGHVQSTYGVNPAAEDTVFNLPYPSAEYSFQDAGAAEIYTAWLLSHTGDTEVRLFRSDKKDWPSGSKIMLNGMAFRVSPGDGVWQMVGGGGSSGGGIDVDDELVDGSKNPVAGGAVKSAIDELRKAVEDIEVGGGGSSISIGDGEPTGAASTGDVYIDARTGDMWQYE